MEGLLDREGKLTSERESRFRYYRKTFLYSLILACCITVPFIIIEWVRTGHGIFLYYGDYNAQQLAFYRHCVDAVHSGNFGWDWFTDIGSNFVASYSYYMLGSPFFWIMCLFPSSFAPYLMGPIYILKYITAALLAYAYLHRFVRNKDYAVLGALLYAFCGFQIYNTFFNQFHEVVAFFPLLLIGMEEYVQNNRKGLFALAVCLNAMINYFMFAGQVAFCVMYFMFRFSDRSFRVTLKKFFGLVLEAVMGFVMSMVLFLPGALGVIGNDRVGHSFSTLKSTLFYWKSGELYWQRYGQILESYFFPPDIPSRVNFFYGHTERWASISGYLPLFSMSGVFALFTTKRRNWLKALIVFLILCSFVPGLNSLFFLGQSAYYARWMYLMVLMFCLGTIIALDDEHSRWKGALASCLAAMAAIAVPLGLLWYDKPDTDQVDFRLGRAPFTSRFWLCVLIGVAGLLCVWYLIKRYRGTKTFSRWLLVSTGVCIVVFGCQHIANGKEHSHSSDFMVDQVLMGEDVQLPDYNENFYRIDFYRTDSLSTLDNLGIYWHYPSMECFHTVVPPSLMDFYDLLSYNRSVGSRALSSWYGLRSLTSTQYSFIESSRNKLQTETVALSDTESIEKYDSDSSWSLVSETETERTYAKQTFVTDKGWSYYDTQNGYDIYSNDNHLPMGFCFDEFMRESEFKQISSGFQRSCLLCTYLIVPDEEADYYAQFMKEATYKNRKSANYETFKTSVRERRAQNCTNFVWGSYGFSAEIDTDEKEIVFFSVPYEDTKRTGGWRATVNGEEANVLKVDAGFMAVEVPAGHSDIVFTYRTRGLPFGALLTGAALLAFAAYMLFWKLKKHKADYRFFDSSYYEEGDVNLPARPKKSKQKLACADDVPPPETSVDVFDEPSGEIPFDAPFDAPTQPTDEPMDDPPTGDS